MRNLINSIYAQVRLEMEAENDVEKYIGKPIKFKWSLLDNGKPLDAIVGGIAEGVGYTIVKASDKSFNLVCSNGPKSPNTITDSDGKSYAYAVEALKAGFYDMDEAYKRRGKTPGNSQADCAFNPK